MSRPRWPRRVARAVAAVLALVALGCGVAGVAPAVAPAGAVHPTTQLVTPLWSARRVPRVVLGDASAQQGPPAAARLQAGLDADVAPYQDACFVVADGSSVLASHNATEPLVPASTQKLLTGAAALARLGADFRYTTRVVSSGAAGASMGTLWLVGAGDPVLRTTDLIDAGVSTPFDVLANQLAAAGVRRVGRVVVDDGRYDGERFLPSWKPSYRTDVDITPLGALTVNQSVTLVSGRAVVADDPALFAGMHLEQRLRALGVTVDADTTRGAAPAGATTVASVDSQPLARIVAWMFAQSDNLSAELLTKELGVRFGAGGTTNAGLAVIRSTLLGLGVPLDGQTMVDGSGLDRANRLTCTTLRAVVALGDRPDLGALRGALPAVSAPAGDDVRAKGGYLDGVTGLAGDATGTRGWEFAFLANGGVPVTANADLARFVAALVAAQPAPLPAQLVPAPESVRPRR